MAFLYQELIRDVIANRPATGSKGQRFTATDTNEEFYHDGASWQIITQSASHLVGSIPESQVTNLTADLAAKAPLASPTFTGTPTAPTAASSDNSTQVATTAFVQNAVSGLGTATPAAIQQESYTYGSDTGTANAYAVTLTPIPNLTAGSEINFIAANANTGASTLAVNSGAAKAITKSGTNALTGGEIASGQIVTLKYDGTGWQMVSGGGAAQPFLVPYSVAGKPAAGLTLYLDIPSTLTTAGFAANFAGSTGRCGTNPTATAVYTIAKNGTTVGTITISTSGTFTFATTGGATVTLAPGDELSIAAPSPQDATLSDVRFTLAGSR